MVDPELVDAAVAPPATETRLAELSERERTVLALWQRASATGAIAARLWLTQKTVETHVRHILAKLALPPDADHNRRVLAVLTFLRSQG